MVERSGIEPEKQVNAIEKTERLQFVEKIKNFRLTVTGFRDYNEAIITRGGICVKEVNPSTMESKLVSGLFFAGEVLDLDALVMVISGTPTTDTILSSLAVSRFHLVTTQERFPILLRTGLVVE